MVLWCRSAFSPRSGRDYSGIHLLLCRWRGWGASADGELGAGTIEQFSAPVGVAGDFTALATGDRFACGVGQDQRAYCWGRNDVGQLGIGTAMGKDLTPMALPTPVGGSIKFHNHISVGFNHACAQSTEGRQQVYCWGSGEYGKLGTGGRKDSPAPVPVTQSKMEHDYDLRGVSAGSDHTCVIEQTFSHILCWGRNTHYQLGKKNGVFDSSFASPQVAEMKDEMSSWLHVSAGHRSSCAIGKVRRATYSTAYCWGSNEYGTVGNDAGKVQESMAELKDVYVALSTRGDTTCGVRLDRKLYCWGLNRNGQVGDGTTENRRTPVPVNSPHRFNTVSVGNTHTCAVTVDSTLYCWGSNELGQVDPKAPRESYSTPQLVNGQWSEVAAGWRSSYGVYLGPSPPLFAPPAAG